MRVKRSLLLLVFAALPAYGFRPTPRPGDRIGILRMSSIGDGEEASVARAVETDLRDELRGRGFDAYDAGLNYGQLARDGTSSGAGYYVEVVSGRAINNPLGSAVAGNDDLAVEVSVVVARVAAELRLYDARTLELLETYDLQKSKTALIPTALGVAGRSIWASIALPFIRYGEDRIVAHDVARDAAARIAGQ